MFTKKKDSLKQLDIAIKKYDIKKHDLLIFNVGSDVPEEICLAFQEQIAKSIAEIGIDNVSMLLMTDPGQLFRLNPSDMAVLGWFRMEETFIDRLNEIGVVTYSEALTLRMMVKKLQSMKPTDTKKLLDRKMRTHKGNNRFKRKRGKR